jgi:hypothetical protein
MSTAADDNATTVVILREPGLVYVKIADPKPGRERIEPLLRKTIDIWFNARPQLAIDRSEAVVEDDEMQGIHVWYHVIDHPRELTNAHPPEQSTSMTIEVHGAVAEHFPKEYVEAVIGDAVQISLAYKDRPDTLVVVNPRRIAAILDRTAHRGAVVPVDLIAQVIEGSMKTRLQTWLAVPASRFYVMHIAGSFFAGG